MAVLTAFTTPLSLGLAPRLVAVVDKLLPKSLRRLINLHEDWVARFRDRPRRTADTPKLVKAIRTLALDAVVFTLLLVLTASFHADAVAWIRTQIAVSTAQARYCVIIVLLICLAPILLSAVKNSLAFSRLLAEMLLPSDGVDPLMVRVSRHTLRLTVLLAATLGLGVPVVAVLRPVAGGLIAGLLLACLVVALVFYLYRSVNALDQEFESSAETLASLLASQVHEVQDTVSDPSLLPGLDHARSVLLGTSAYAVDKTLGQVHLRAMTGATVIAIRHQDKGVVLPTGHEALRPGDRLALIGTDEALGRADTLLNDGPQALAERDSVVLDVSQGTGD